MITAQGQPSSLSHSTNRVLNDEALEAVSKYAFFPVRNRNGEVVGEVRAEFKLNREIRRERMSVPESRQNADQLSHPPLLRDPSGHVDVDSVPDVIQWFLDYDSRVAIIKHPRVEEVFQWKQEQSRQNNEEVFVFSRLRIVWQLGLSRLLARTPRNAAFTPGLGSCSMRSTRPQRLTKPFLAMAVWTSQLRLQLLPRPLRFRLSEDGTTFWSTVGWKPCARLKLGYLAGHIRNSMGGLILPMPDTLARKNNIRP